MKRWIIALIALAIGLTPAVIVNAQEAPVLPKANESDAETAEESLTVPVKINGLMFVEVMVNGQGPYDFLFDSGASMNVLNQRLATELDLEEHDVGAEIQGVGGTIKAKMAILDELEIGAFKRGKCVAIVLDLDHMSGDSGKHMMGIIGQNTLDQVKEFHFDFVENTMKMTEFETRPASSDAPLLQQLEGGGGIPGFPGFPGGGVPEPDEDEADPDDDDEEDFSFTPAQQQWLFQVEEDLDEVASQTLPSNPTQNLNLEYTTVSIMGMTINPTWTLTAEMSGEEYNFMFDTGAGMSLVLSEELAEEAGCVSSFEMPVKGMGVSVAKATIVDSFSVGNFEAEEISAVIIALPKMSEQLLGQLGIEPIEDIIEKLTEKLAVLVGKQIAEQLLKQLGGLDDILNKLLEMQGIVLDFDGIIGIPLAYRYKSFTVNTEDKTLEFEAYGEGEVNAHAPYEGEEGFKEAALRTWRGEAGSFGLIGDSIMLDDWKNLGLENGGMRVSEVIKDAAAMKAGLREDDIVTSMSFVDNSPDGKGETVNAPIRELTAIITTGCLLDPGTEVTLTVRRGKEELKLKVILDKYEWTGVVPDRYK
ncbi:MAG: aspartyl protease family protein [Planctomycetota bacterium]